MRLRSILLFLLATQILLLGGIKVRTAAALEPQTDAFERTWGRTDEPVASEAARRTWMWGPSGFTAGMLEPYAESPDEMRQVQYFDKSRMEITDPDAPNDGLWYVTNGLLVVELVTGRMQLGDNTFEQHGPAQINVAGDPDSGPSYAAFNPLRDDPYLATGTVIDQWLAANGRVSRDPALVTKGVRAAHHVPETRHTVAQPFWDFMTSSGTVLENGSHVDADLFENPFYATGFPITEAYWTRVTIAGEPNDVLVQCFERRCLTYTPDNAPEWKVEMGNAGQHYYQWRYGADIPDDPQPVDLGYYDSVAPIPIIEWPIDNAGDSWIVIGNQGPYPMTIALDGPASHTLSIPACEDCESYDSDAAFDGCRTDIPYQKLMTPPGNYRVQISWDAGDITPAAGAWTLVPDADYGICYYIVLE